MSDQDPAVSGWQEATEAHMAASSSAIGRDLQSQLDRLRQDYNAVLLERDEAVRRAADLEQVREELNESRKLVEAVACVKALVEDQRDELVNKLHAMAKDLGAAIFANDQLKRKNEQLTADKGLAATEKTHG